MDVTFSAVAIQLSARVLDPVLQVPAMTSVSLVIAIVIVPAEVSFTKVSTVPIGYATFAFESIVHVRAVVSEEGWYMCFPASVRTVVYAALLEFWRIHSVPTFTHSTAILPDDTRDIVVSVACQSSISDVVKIFQYIFIIHDSISHIGLDAT